MEDKKKNPSSTINKLASEVLTASLVTGIPSIVVTKNKWRKSFKIFVLIFCACGFFYQATTFLKTILTYPSVLDVDMYMPERIDMPAMTFCSNNGISRTKFCTKYSDKCYTPENVTQFCKLHKSFCNSLDSLQNLTLPNSTFFDFERDIEFDELIELSEEIPVYLKHWFSGPYVLATPEKRKLICYSSNLHVDSSSRSLSYQITNDPFQEKLGNGTFMINPSEIFRPTRTPGVLFSIHSPYLFENPYYKGIFLRTGKEYHVYVKVEEENLLPYPYPNNCENYTKNWEEHNYTGPRSQEGCRDKCLYDILMSSCNCSALVIPFPHQGRICFELEDCQNPTELESRMEEFNKCFDSCRDDCQKLKYTYTFQTRQKEHQQYSESKNTIRVTIFLEDSEVINYKYRPQYQDLEVISYIGGFLGAWLGISFVAIVDLFESFTSIACFVLRKRKQHFSEII